LHAQLFRVSGGQRLAPGAIPVDADAVDAFFEEHYRPVP
jgi:hypothetical protein